MIAARALRVLKQNMGDGAKEYGVNAPRIAYASTVLDYAPVAAPARGARVLVRRIPGRTGRDA